MKALEHTERKKLLGRALVCGFVMAVVMSFFPFAAACGSLPENVVRLHVIDHQVIDRPVFQDRADIVDELFAERYFDRVDQSDFFVDDQV